MKKQKIMIILIVVMLAICIFLIQRYGISHIFRIIGRFFNMFGRVF